VVIVLVIIFAVLGGIAWCSFSLTKDKQILFWNKMTGYEFLGCFVCPPVRRRDPSLNSGPGSDEHEEEKRRGKTLTTHMKRKGATRRRRKKQTDKKGVVDTMTSERRREREEKTIT